MSQSDVPSWIVGNMFSCKSTSCSISEHGVSAVDKEYCNDGRPERRNIADMAFVVVVVVFGMVPVAVVVVVVVVVVDAVVE